MENQPTESITPTPQKKNSLIIVLLIIVIALAFVLGGLIVFIVLKKTTSSPTSSVTPTPTQTQSTATPSPTQTSSSFCLPANIVNTLSLSPGAGNVYGTFKITNTSTQPCQIEGNHFVQATYDTNTIKNLTITHQGDNTTALYTLQPNQSLYSQVHYPNGPQCSGPTVEDPVTFTYLVGNNNSVTFKDAYDR